MHLWHRGSSTEQKTKGSKRQKGFVESYIGRQIPQETGLPAQIPAEESRGLHGAPSSPGSVFGQFLGLIFRLPTVESQLGPNGSHGSLPTHDIP